MKSLSFRKDLVGVQDELLRFAYKLTTDREEANDLLQETSLKALDNEDKYTPDTNFKGWMYTIMRNIFINNYRKVVRDQTFIDQTDNLYHLNLPQDGLYTFVSNHPLGGQDGVALGYVLGKHYEGKVKYLVNDLLMNLRGLAPLCIPINKTGKQAKDFPKMVEAGFQSDDQLIMFPAGLCSRRQNGVIRDLEWKKTFVVKSIQAKRDVIPVHFGGRNSDFFYNLANVCKALGIKFNIAMLYLADEMFKNRHKTFTVTFGKPIPWQTFDKSKTPAQWAEYVKDIVYKL